MSEKINIQDLAALLAVKSGITKKEAEAFLRECFDIIDEALTEDKLVKVKNLGSFKLALMEDRESIDVASGERVLIPAHYKVSFSSDKSLAETINEPFALFEAVEINDDYSDEETSSSEAISSDLQEENEESEEFVENEVAEEHIEEEYIETKEVETDELAETNKTSEITDTTETPDSLDTKNLSENKNPTKEIEEKQDIIQITEATTIESEIPETNNQEVKNSKPIIQAISSEKAKDSQKSSPRPQKKKKSWINLAISLILLVIIVYIGFFIYKARSGYQPHQADNTPVELSNESTSANKAANTTGEVSSNNLPEKVEAIEDTLSNDIKAEPNSEKIEKPVQNSKNETKPSEPVAGKKHKIAVDERLALISLEEYGHRAFWVYIYEENKNIIVNPNKVNVGMEIIIPPPAKYGIDKNNPESVQKALDKAKQYK